MLLWSEMLRRKIWYNSAKVSADPAASINRDVTMMTEKNVSLKRL
jgi:hypothetical protein